MPPAGAHLFPPIDVQSSAVVTVSTNDLTATSLTVTNGSLDASGLVNMTINGDLSIAAGCSFVAPSGNLYVGGGFTNAGTFTNSSGLLVFDATTAGHTITTGGSSLWDVTFNDGATSGGWTFSDNTTIGGTFTMTSGAVDLGASRTHSVNTVTTAGGTLDFNTAMLDATGNIDLSGLASLNGSTGTLRFSAAGAQSLTPHTGTVHPQIEVQSGSTVTPSADLMANGIAVNGGTFDASLLTNVDLYADLSVASTGTFTASANMTVGQNFRIYSGSVFNNNSGTITLDGTNTSRAIQLSGNTFNNLIVNSPGAGSWVPMDNLTTDGTLAVSGGTLDLSTYTLTVTGLLQINGGTLDASGGSIDANSNLTLSSGTLVAPSGTMTVGGAGGTVWNQTGGTFSHNGGNVELDNTMGSGIVASDGFNNLSVNVSGGGAYLSSNVYVANNLTHTAGPLSISGYTLSVGNNFTLNGGEFSGGSGDLSITGDCSLNSGSFTAPGSGDSWTIGGGLSIGTLGTWNNNSGTITLDGTTGGSVDMAGQSFFNMTVNGSGGIWTCTGPLSGELLTVSNGTLDLGTGHTHAVLDISAAGGLVEFNTATLQVANSANLNGANVGAGTGILELNGTSQTLTPPVGQYLPHVKCTGGGVVVQTNGLNANQLTVTTGTWDWGDAGLGHIISGDIACPGGIMDFGTSNVYVNSNCDLSGLTNITYTNAGISFTGTGTQVFTPKAGVTLPAIDHSNTGTLQLAGNTLTAQSFSQSSGVLDFNGQNLTTSGNFSITNGTYSSVVNLGGRTITAGGNATFDGTSGDSLNLDPATEWYISVTGDLTANDAKVANSNASGGSMGISTGNCIDGGGNTNWDFTAPSSVVTYPVDGSSLNGLSSITGTAGDGSGAGIAYVMLQLRRDSDNYSWNGTSWAANGVWLSTSGSTTWSFGSVPFLLDGDYTILTQAFDNSDNVQTSFGTASFTIETETLKPTLSTPSSGAILGADIAVDFSLPEAATSGSVKLTFVESGSSDDANDPHIITTTFNAAGQHSVTLNGFDLSDAATGVSSVRTDPDDILVEGATYDLILEYKDAVGNAQAYDTAYSVLFQDYDIWPPQNTIDPTLTVVGDSAVQVAWEIDSNMIGDAEYVVGTYRHESADAADSAAIHKTWYPYSDTVFTVETSIQGTWYFGVALADTAKNVSDFKYDTLSIENTAPVILSADSTATLEDSIWAHVVQVYDVNNDEITLTPLDKPAAMTFSASSSLLRWTPGNDDVGAHTVNIAASDGNGGHDTLSMKLVVVNTNDVPEFVEVDLPDTVYEDSAVTGAVTASDVDLGDSLALQLGPKFSWLTASADAASDQGDFLFTLAGAPGNADTGLIIDSVTIRDKSGAKVSVPVRIYVVDVNDPPETEIKMARRAFGAARFTAVGTDDNDTVLTYYAYLRLAGATAVSMQDSNAAGLFTFAPLSDGRYVFECYAMDAEGLKDPTPATDTFDVQGATSHTYADTGSWYMLGIPSAGYPAGELKADGHLSQWDESAPRRNIYGYYVDDADIEEISRGKAYWRKASKPLTVDIADAAGNAEACSVAVVAGEFGWNQLSSPFPYPIKWSRPGALWRWDAGERDYVEVMDSALNPWEGYWYLADSTDTVVVGPSPYFANKTLAKRARTFFVNQSHWQVRMILTSGLNRDRDNLIGFGPKARDGHDIFDRAEPPRIGANPYVFIAHPEWKRNVTEYASDIRRTFHHDKNVFHIGLGPVSAEAGAVTLRADGLRDLSDVYFFIGNQHGVVEMTADSAYRVAPSDSVTYRTVFVSADKDFLKRLPLKFRVANPYPNPFGARVNLSYTLPYRWQSNGMLNEKPYHVRMEIFDARGRLVRKLVRADQHPGHYRIVWDGTAVGRKVVASGAYFCRLSAGKYQGISRMMLLR
ncbi:MAG: hypothetical protein GF410_14610 [Chitinivibrionales bacterium]|nr:hypothetical protein [Chitinivibrionales bacterium]